MSRTAAQRRRGPHPHLRHGARSGGRTVTLSTKETVAYGTALLATGAMVRRLQIDGVQLDGIHYLRALGNADSHGEDAETVGERRLRRRLLHRLRERGDARELGKGHGRAPGGGADGARVRLDRPARVRRVLEAHGVQVGGSVEVERFEGSERVQRVVLAGGDVVADLVVSPASASSPTSCSRARPGWRSARTVAWARRACAPTARRPLRRRGHRRVRRPSTAAVVRIEHEELAVSQGPRSRATCSAPGRHTPMCRTSSATSLTGRRRVRRPGARWDDEVLEGDIAAGAFAIRYLAGGKVRRCSAPVATATSTRARAHPGLSAARARPAISATVTGA